MERHKKSKKIAENIAKMVLVNLWRDISDYAILLIKIAEDISADGVSEQFIHTDQFHFSSDPRF